MQGDRFGLSRGTGATGPDAPPSDAQKQVTLQKLGPDELDDTDNCERR